MRRRSGAARLRSLDAPLPALAASLGVALLLALAALSSRHWDPSRFVVAGSNVTDPRTAPPGLFVVPGDGYDGQFFYRLALDPFTHRKTDFGITLDDPAYRQQRILYPLTAWLVSLGGRPRLVPWALFGVNVVGIAGLGLVGASLAGSLGRHRLWGLAISLYPGFTLTLLRDLSEILAALFLLAGLAALRRGRRGVAPVSLALAVLARETTVVVPVAGLAWLAWRSLERRRQADRGVRVTQAGAEPSEAGDRRVPWVAFAFPLACFAGWQLFLRARWGTSGLESGRGSATVPFSAALRQVRLAVGDASLSGARLAVEIVLVMAFLAYVASRLRRSSLVPYATTACALYLVLATLLAGDVWADDWSFLRVLSEAMVLGALALLSRDRRGTAVLAATVSCLWLLVVPSLGLSG